MAEQEGNKGSEEVGETGVDTPVRSSAPKASKDGVRATGNLGITRWVQFIWIFAAVLLFGIYSKAIFLGWDYFEEPRDSIITPVALLLAIGTAIFLYKHEKVNAFTREVLGRIQKVIWPTREETWSQTLVVIVVSVVAAILLGVMDFAWGHATKFVYSAGIEDVQDGEGK